MKDGERGRFHVKDKSSIPIEELSALHNALGKQQMGLVAIIVASPNGVGYLTTSSVEKSLLDIPELGQGVIDCLRDQANAIMTQAAMGQLLPPDGHVKTLNDDPETIVRKSHVM